MGQVLHGSPTTTAAVRRAILHSQESIRALAERYGVNLETIGKWKSRDSVVDRKTGPKVGHSTVLTVPALVDGVFVLALAAYNRIRLPKLLSAPA